MTTPTPTGLHAQQPWPARVTARIVTRMGLLLRNPDAAVDITTRPGDGINPTVHEAICRPCGWTRLADADRNKTLDKAQDHADQCTALPNPAQDGAVITPAIHHSH